MRKGLIILILLLVIVFGVIGIQQADSSHSNQTETESISYLQH